MSLFRRKAKPWQPIGSWDSPRCTWCRGFRILRGLSSAEGVGVLWWCPRCDEAEPESTVGLALPTSSDTTEEATSEGAEGGDEPDASSTTTEPQARQRTPASIFSNATAATSQRRRWA